MAISDLRGDNIADIGNLVFFTEKGYEVPTEKIYTIQWEIIPCQQINNNFIDNPSGHFMYDINDPERNIIIVIDNPGKIVRQDVTIRSQADFEGNVLEKTISADDIILASTVYIDDDGEIQYEWKYYKSNGHQLNRNTGQYEIIKDSEEFKERVGNKVRITINTLAETFIQDYPIEYVFNNAQYADKTSNIIIDNNEDSFVYSTLSDISLVNIEGTLPTSKTFINEIIEQNYSYDSLFPCVRYTGIIKQDKVSTEFIATSTFIILENYAKDSYERPNLGVTPYNLYFEFQNNSEMRFISSDTISEIIWNDSYTASVGQEGEIHQFNELLKKRSTPIYFTVGFETELEGCYQNIMAMYLKTMDDTKYLLGLFTFLTEVEGEDERYRALLGNLGIPDPIKYPNVFKEQDPFEQGVDWTLINNKSKELMLTYDDIFPYAGTYKALLGAIKFLGYQDLIFKEWYKIKDSHNKDRYVTLQTYDLNKGVSLKSKLKQFGIEFGEFERYKKLNRLSMIYHLNEIDDETGEYISYYTKHDGIVTRDTQFLQLPTTYRLYEYRTDEILAKLFSVKQWLEKYILGVNCFITDICGEYIVLERVKTQAYVTEHHLHDIASAGCFTPKITNTTQFNNSESVITCSLNEFDSITFENYENFSIGTFIKEEWKPNNSDSVIYISAPLETLVTATEYQFKLTNNNSSSGSLAEFTDKNYITNPLLVQDNKLLFFDDTQNTTKIDPSELPIIEIIQGNLRFCHGNWNDNIAYSINSIVDQNTGHEYYSIYDETNDDIFYRGTKKVMLYPYIKSDQMDIYRLYWYQKLQVDKLPPESEGSEMIYTTNTKWNIPMLIIRNYTCGNNNELLTGDFILEIVKGRLLFRNHKTEINHGKAEGCEIVFEQEFEGREQPIDITYLYVSDREPIYTFDKSLLTDLDSITEDDILQCVSTNRYVDVSVNRIGSYTIQVEAYDAYNNIFVNNSDDITVINAPGIEIDTILNQDYMINEPTFFDTNKYGLKLDDEKVSSLFNNIEKYAETPLYPQTYRLYDIDPVLDNPKAIEYDNISYAITPPNIGDFIIFNNFTERVVNIEKGTDAFKLTLLDENPNYETILNSSYVGLCIYDNLQKTILSDIYPLEVTDNTHIHEQYEYHIYDTNKSYIMVKQLDSTMELSDDNITLVSLYNQCVSNDNYLNNHINAYIYSANEYILDADKVITVDYDNKLTYIKDSVQHFMKNQVIKICLTNDVLLHNQYTRKSIDNETTYRIIDVIENSESVLPYTYIIDGIVDVKKLNNKLYHNNNDVTVTSKVSPLQVANKYKLKMCPAHLRAAQYILRIDSYGEELAYKYNNSTIMKTRVEYCPSPLLFNDYLDTTYSAQIYDYDPKLLQNIWCNPLTLYTENDPLYVYRNFPVTVNKGRTVIMLPNTEQTVLSTNFNDTNVDLKINWNWKSYLIDDQSNWHSNLDLIGKQIIFKSVNKILCVKPELLGTQTTQMICCDVYGNRVINEGDGFVYVDNKGTIVNDKENNTRDIYYKDLFIVGFSYQFMPTSVVNMQGGTQQFSLTSQDNMSASQNIESNNIIYTYKIYYNDGTVLENEGADTTLLTSTGKASKTNKVKIKFNKANHSHKYLANHVNARIKFNKTHERDLLKPEQLIEIPIYQYGSSITTDIYNLTFNIIQLPKEGIEELNNTILNAYITDIQYTLTRTDGEVEVISANTLYDGHLEIISYKFMHNQYGQINYIPESKVQDIINIGLLQLNVKFYVNGVETLIQTCSICNVYQ